MTVHVIGGGLAGLSAAIAVAGRGERVILSEAAKQAGGRCRSYHDGQPDRTRWLPLSIVMSSTPS